MSTNQPKALQLADEMQVVCTWHGADQAAEELRRLHAQNQVLLDVLREGQHLIEVARMPNAEYVADAHNSAVQRIQDTLAKFG